MRGAGLLALALALLLAPEAPALSLFPDRSGRDHLAALDGLPVWRPALRLGHWQPYGLPGVEQSALALAGGRSAGRGEIAILREDWGVLAAWRLRARLLAEPATGLRVGVEGEWQALDGAASDRTLHLLTSFGAPLALSLRLGLASGADALAPPSLLGLSYGGEGWRLRLWREEAAEGIAVAWCPGSVEFELLVLAPGWQGLAIRGGGERWRVVVEERRHAWLGGSHGLWLELR